MSVRARTFGRAIIAVSSIVALAFLIDADGALGPLPALLIVVCVAALVWACVPLLERLFVGEHFDEDVEIHHGVDPVDHGAFVVVGGNVVESHTETRDGVEITVIDRMNLLYVSLTDPDQEDPSHADPRP